MNNIKNQRVQLTFNPYLAKEESEHYLLFNRQNTTTLKISKPMFALLEAARSANGVIDQSMFTKHARHLSILKRFRFIDFSLPPIEQINISDVTKNLIFNPSGRLSLTSNTAPINVIWAITGACNLKCLYCFPECSGNYRQVSSVSDDMVFKIAKNIVDAKVLFVRISGGEALLRRNLFEIIDYFIANNIEVTMVSNGTLITPQIAKQIASRDIRMGVSVDSCNEDINALTRGKGVLARTSEGIRNLVCAGVKINLTTVLTKHNIHHVEELAQFSDSMGTAGITFQELVPFGNPDIYLNSKPSLQEENEFHLRTIPKLRSLYPHLNFSDGELFSYCFETRPEREYKVMECQAGSRFAYIDSSGNFYPCTSLAYEPFWMGDVTTHSIAELWATSTARKELRSLCEKAVTKLKGCGNCDYSKRCAGGCRGEAYFMSKDVLGQTARCYEVTKSILAEVASR
ncbi:MAG: radical SAM protein [Oligoflexia bacterium]|nr:radical SAM protein [Oligoflexia bacterium]